MGVQWLWWYIVMKWKGKGKEYFVNFFLFPLFSSPLLLHPPKFPLPNSFSLILYSSIQSCCINWCFHCLHDWRHDDVSSRSWKPTLIDGWAAAPLRSHPHEAGLTLIYGAAKLWIIRRPPEIIGRVLWSLSHNHSFSASSDGRDADQTSAARPRHTIQSTTSLPLPSSPTIPQLSVPSPLTPSASPSTLSSSNTRLLKITIPIFSVDNVLSWLFQINRSTLPLTKSQMTNNWI